MGSIDGQVETYPAFAVALEALDVSGTQGRGLGASVEFGRHLQIKIGKARIFIQAVHGLFSRLAKGRQQGEAEQQ